jgi:hypothetical protein
MLRAMRGYRMIAIDDLLVMRVHRKRVARRLKLTPQPAMGKPFVEDTCRQPLLAYRVLAGLQNSPFTEALLTA